MRTHAARLHAQIAVAAPMPRQKYKSGVFAMSTQAPQSFLVRIVNTQNATWQGKITWVDKNQTQDFRSALELIKLIDSALEEKGGQEAAT